MKIEFWNWSTYSSGAGNPKCYFSLIAAVLNNSTPLLWSIKQLHEISASLPQVIKGNEIFAKMFGNLFSPNYKLFIEFLISSSIFTGSRIQFPEVIFSFERFHFYLANKGILPWDKLELAREINQFYPLSGAPF